MCGVFETHLDETETLCGGDRGVIWVRQWRYMGEIEALCAAYSRHIWMRQRRCVGETEALYG